MATTVAKLLVEIGAETGNAEHGLRRVTQLVEELRDRSNAASSKVTSGFHSIGKAALVGFSGAAVAAAGLGGGFLALAGRTTMAAARVGEMGAVLDLLGSRAGWTKEQIHANVDAMRDLGIRTDVAQEMLAQFARNQLDAADATMAARVAQDLAVLSGRDSSETLAELSYAIQTQNSNLQVFRDLGIQAGEAMDRFARSLGKETSELTKAERMQAMLNAVRERGIEIEGVYVTAMKEPGKLIRSLSRHFYEAGLAIGQNFVPALGVGVEWVTRFIKGIRGMLEEGQPLHGFLSALGKFVATLAEKLGALAERAFGGLVEAMAPVAEWLTMTIEKITEFVDRVSSGVDPLVALRELLTLAFGADTASGIMNVVETIRNFAELVGGAIGPVISWFSENVKLQDILLVLGAAIASVVVPALISVISTLAPVIATFLAAIAVVALLREAWESNFLGIRDLVTSAIGKVKEIIVNTVAKIREFWAAHGDEILAKARAVWESIKLAVQGGIEKAQAIVASVAAGIQEFWASHGDEILAKAQEVWEFVKTTIQVAIEGIQEIVTSVATGIQEFWASHGDEILAKAQTVWDIISQTVGLAIQNISTIVVTVMTMVKEFWDENGEAILQAAERVWSFILKIVGGILGAIAGIFYTILSAIQSLWQAHGDQLMNIAQNVWNIIRTNIGIALNIIFGIIKTVVALIRGNWEGAWDAIMETTAKVCDGISQIITAALEIVKTIIDIALSYVKDLWEQVWSSIESFIVTIWSDIVQIITTTLAAVKMLIDLGLNYVKNLWEQTWNSIKETAKTIWDGIGQLISTALNTVKTSVTVGLIYVKSLWDEVWNGVKETVVGIWNSIVEEITRAVDGIVEKVRHLVQSVKGMINNIIGGLNKLIYGWNSLEFHVPGFDVEVPPVNLPGIGPVGGFHLGWEGISIETRDINPLPTLAQGGIVTRPTLALIGEEGPEAVLPLSKLDLLAERIAMAIMQRPTFVVNASYRYQSEHDLRDDLRLLQMLGAAV